MAFKFFKKKEKEEEKEPQKAEAEEIEIGKEKRKEEEKKERKVEKKEKGQRGEAWRYIIAPHITEKASYLAEKNQYVFKVSKDANKIEIKKAIGDLFGVEVEKIRIIKVPKKRRRRGRIEGWKKGYKKAIVKIKEGQKIEILPR